MGENQTYYDLGGPTVPRDDSILLSKSAPHDTERNCSTEEKQTWRESKLISAIFILLVLVVTGFSVLVTLQYYGGGVIFC